jgi:hypothetical protein
MRTILSDKFSLDILESYPKKVIIDKVEKEEFCTHLEFSQEMNELINTITDKDLINEISDLCGFDLIEGKDTLIKLKNYDEFYVVTKEGKKIVIYEILI